MCEDLNRPPTYHTQQGVTSALTAKAGSINLQIMTVRSALEAVFYCMWRTKNKMRLGKQIPPLCSLANQVLTFFSRLV